MNNKLGSLFFRFSSYTFISLLFAFVGKTCWFETRTFVEEFLRVCKVWAVCDDYRGFFLSFRYYIPLDRKWQIYCKKYLQKMLGLERKKLNKDLIIMVSELWRHVLAKMKLESDLELIFTGKISLHELIFVVWVSSQSQFPDITIWNISGKTSGYYG